MSTTHVCGFANVLIFITPLLPAKRQILRTPVIVEKFGMDATAEINTGSIAETSHFNVAAVSGSPPTIKRSRDIAQLNKLDSQLIVLALLVGNQAAVFWDFYFFNHRR